MGKQRTVRFDDILDTQVDQFTEINDLKFNRLVNLAVKKYITERNIIELEPITLEASDSQWEEGITESFSKHKKAMGELA
jgi:hypothetical protein